MECLKTCCHSQTIAEVQALIKPQCKWWGKGREGGGQDDDEEEKDKEQPVALNTDTFKYWLFQSWIHIKALRLEVWGQRYVKSSILRIFLGEDRTVCV